MKTLKILVMGRGRMGHAVKAVAEDRGHTVVDLWGREALAAGKWPEVDVAIDFTLPESAVEVFSACRHRGLPLVSGTTGWLEDFDTVEVAVREAGHPMVWAPNFSVGVHLFRKAMRQLEQMLEGHGFQPSITETHHTGKVDAPSGTALALACDLKAGQNEEVPVHAVRLPGVPGTHRIDWDGAVDRISLEHSAKDRTGFALGAVRAAEWLLDQPGPFTKIFSLDDVWG
jgi:4-hydroxy-tetrahydrodipicolinate reductase